MYNVCRRHSVVLYAFVFVEGQLTGAEKFIFRLLTLRGISSTWGSLDCSTSVCFLALSADCNGNADKAVVTDRKLPVHSQPFCPDRASLELFLDIGVRLHQQLTLLKVSESTRPVVERLHLKVNNYK